MARFFDSPHDRPEGGWLEFVQPEPEGLYVVRCSALREPMSHPMPLIDAQYLANYYNDNQGEDYCLGDHTVEAAS